MPRSYVNNSYNQSLGRVGMPVGSMPVSRGSSGASSGGGGASYYGSSSGGSSSGYGGSPMTYVDNSYNRSVGRVGMEHGTAVISKSSSSGGGGGASSGVSSSGESGYGGSPKTYVDNKYNRSIGRVGMEHGTAVISKSSSASQSSSSNTYVDNAYNRSAGRVGLEHGTAVISRSSSGTASSSSGVKVYKDNSFNRSVGRVGLPIGDMVMSRSSKNSSSDSTGEKVYKDNSFNRSVGRVGLPIGDMVMSRSSKNSSSGSTGEKVYKDTPFNQRVGRAGLPLGSMIMSRSGKTSTQSTKGKTEPTKAIWDMLDQYYNHPNNDVDLHKWRQDGRDPYYMEEASEQAADLINRFEQIRLWQEKSRTDRQPTTSRDLLQMYSGERIQFDDLALTERIGHGGFGDVYFAKWKETVVAVKKLRVQRVSKKRLQEFTSEINIFCTLDHPNIVKFIGACCVTPNIAIVMEYMEGSLFHKLHMADDTPTEEEKLDIIKQVARGLEYLHKKNIAHCDIKSQNVLLNKNDESYEAKITDFGLSMMKSNSDTSSTRHTEVRNLGTPRYSAPEVLRGELLDRASMMKTDVYSLGLVVFEVISEEEPFDTLNAKQLERYVGNGLTIPAFGSDVGQFVQKNVKECWSRDPSSRPSAFGFRYSVEKWKNLYTKL